MEFFHTEYKQNLKSCVLDTWQSPFPIFCRQRVIMNQYVRKLDLSYKFLVKISNVGF
jgi:hypothetical protein